MKRYFYFAAAMLLGMTFAACEGNSPTDPKNSKSSVPAVVRSIEGKTAAEAEKTLLDLKYAKVEGEEYVYMYPAELATRVDSVLPEEALQMMLNVEDGKVNGVAGGQLFKSEEKALDGILAWFDYHKKEMAQPKLWVGMYETENEHKYFIAGELGETYKAFMDKNLADYKAMLDNYVAEGMLSEEQAQERYAEAEANAKFGTRDEFKDFVEKVDLSKSFNIVEQIIEVTDEKTVAGIITQSVYEHATNGEEAGAGRVASYNAFVGDVASYLSDFEVSDDGSEAPLKAPKLRLINAK
ncbi:MAG: hypothetical protein IJS13_10490 [Paludibacteraceae bacterium]|nr:hypothetical protein [Paludibacteraceae bacterium]